MGRNIYYWGTPSFSGTGQLDEGPFVLGTVARLLRAKINGALNYQGATIGSSSVFANLLMWGVQVVDHGAGPLDITISTDDDHWLIRQQTVGGGGRATWAPSTDTAADLSSVALVERWAGQKQWNTSLDAYLSFAPEFGGSTPNLNTYGTAEFWWS